MTKEDYCKLAKICSGYKPSSPRCPADQWKSDQYFIPQWAIDNYQDIIKYGTLHR